MYLLIYLHGRDTRTLTKLEEYVVEQVSHCKVDWMPNGHSIGRHKIEEYGQKKDDTLHGIAMVTEQIGAPQASLSCAKI